MEIKIIHSADPALLAALQLLAGYKTTAVTAPGTPVKKGNKKKEEVVEEEAEEEAEEEVEEEDLTGEAEEAESKTTLEQVREAAQKLIAAGKSAKLKEILKTFSAAKVVDVTKGDYDKFLAAVKKVK